MKKGREKIHRICAAFLCVCMLLSLPGISDIFPVVAAAEQAESFQEKNIITAFDPLPEDIKVQTVFMGTDKDELDLPEELTVCLLRKSSEQKAEEGEQENIWKTNDMEKNSDTETRDEQPEDDGESAEKIDETDTEDEEGGTGESAPVEEQGESENGQENAPAEEQQESTPAQETHTVTMQETLAENVIPVQTLENTQTEKQEETVTIDGVTWQSEPEYDENTEGIYIFTAVLPDGYALADGVSLPEITVTVENGIDAIIQALRDRIAALPEVEEYLATEPDMEDEDAYAEWEEKLYEYAEEALAIWEEYEALTGEQQAQITEGELAKLEAWLEIAETLSDNNAVMLAGYSEHHGETNWTALTASDTTLTNGKYYLSADIEMGTITINGGDVMLCLNGHKLQHNGTDGSVIVVGSGTFTLCDCQDHWGYTSSFDEDTKTYSCEMTGTGGCITGGRGTENDIGNICGGGIFVRSGATFNMNSGRITGCDVGIEDNHWGGGVYVTGGTFNMSGGFLDGNTADSGGGVYIEDKAGFTMSGNATVINNEGDAGGGVNIGNSIFNMTSGNILGNKGGGAGGGAIMIGGTSEFPASFIMSGGMIEGNTIKDAVQSIAAGIYCNGGTLILSGGSIQHNIGNTQAAGGIRMLEGTLEVSGNIRISDNYGWNGVNNLSLARNCTITVTGELSNDIGVTYRPARGTVSYPLLVVKGTNSYSISDADWSHFSSDNENYEIQKKETTDTGNELYLAEPGTCDLFTLSTSGATLSPEFKSDTIEYTSLVANSVDQVGITATLADTASGADITIKINDGTTEEMENGVPKTVNLVEGKNTIAVTVTSGGMSKIYTIEITREEAPTGFTVTLNGNGGSAGTNVTSYVPGTKVTLPIDWTKTGYEFAGWYDNENCTGTEVKEISATATGDKEYWAGWTPNTYQVTFDYHGADDGNTTASKNVAYDSKYGALPMPSKRGYTFKGWYTEADGQGSEVDADTVVTKTSDHALHAWWKDETPPNKPVLQDGVTLPADWTNAQNKIPLKLYDGVGVTGLMVSVDGSPFAEVNGFPGGTGSVLYDYAPVPEGEHTYQFKAKDAAGNISAASDIFTVRLDKKKPVIGTLTYENKAKDFLDWIIGKKSMIVHVPVTDEGSGVEKISYTLTPRNADGGLDGSSAETKTAAVKVGGETV